MDWFVFAEATWIDFAFAASLIGALVLVGVVGVMLILGEWGVLTALADRLKIPPRDAYDEKLDATNGRIDMVRDGLDNAVGEYDNELETLAARVYELEKKAGLRP